MQSFNPLQWFKLQQWLKLQRLIPLTTLIVGLGTLSGSLIGLINDAKLINSLILAVLILIAADTLIERIALFEKIEGRLAALSISKQLLHREQLPKLNKNAKLAKEIVILAISGLAIAQTYKQFFEEQLQHGVKVKILLVNPMSENLDWYEKTDEAASVRDNIRASTATFSYLLEKYNKNLSIKYSEIILPFSLVGADINKESPVSYMTVEFHGYKVHYGELPSVLLTPDTDEYWFKIFAQEFNIAWEDAGKELTHEQLKDIPNKVKETGNKG